METKEIRDRLDSKDPRVCVVPLAHKESQERREPEVLKDLKETKDTLDILDFRVSQEPQENKDQMELKDPQVPQDPRVLLVPRDLPVIQDRTDQMDLQVQSV